MLSLHQYFEQQKLNNNTIDSRPYPSKVPPSNGARFNERKSRAGQSRDRSKHVTNSIATGHALRALVEAEMVDIRSAGSAANVRRMRRETVLTRFRGACIGYSAGLRGSHPRERCDRVRPQ
jgi:hypothetical protein